MLPDFYYINGHCVPIRASPGYEVAFEGLTKKDKEHLRAMNDGKGYTVTADRQERAQRVAEAKARAGKPRAGGPSMSREAQEHRFDKRHKSRLY